MSLPYNTSRALFEGNGVAVRFPFTFKVWNIGQLRLMVTSPAGVTEAAKPESVVLENKGGVVTFRHRGRPLPLGWKLVILRNMPFTQGVDLLSGTRFDPQVIEDQMDQATAERQQLLEEVARAVKVPVSSDKPPELLANMIFDARDNALGSAGRAAKSADKAEGEANRSAREAGKILTLAVSAHESPNSSVAAGYTPDTGMLHFYIPRGPQGDRGLTGPYGAQGPQGMQGVRGFQGVQGQVGPPGQAPLVDVLSCGGAAETQLVLIHGGDAASFR